MAMRTSRSRPAPPAAATMIGIGRDFDEEDEPSCAVGGAGVGVSEVGAGVLLLLSPSLVNEVALLVVMAEPGRVAVAVVERLSSVLIPPGGGSVSGSGCAVSATTLIVVNGPTRIGAEGEGEGDGVEIEGDTGTVVAPARVEELKVIADVAAAVSGVGAIVVKGLEDDAKL